MNGIYDVWLRGFPWRTINILALVVLEHEHGGSDFISKSLRYDRDMISVVGQIYYVWYDGPGIAT